jgi:ABC-type dipeptide/oligopeptide/nickel transport system permease subunit
VRSGIANLIVDLAYGFIDPRVKLTDIGWYFGEDREERFEWLEPMLRKWEHIRQTSYWKDARHPLRKNKAAMVCLFIIVIIELCNSGSFFFTIYDSVQHYAIRISMFFKDPVMDICIFRYRYIRTWHFTRLGAGGRVPYLFPLPAVSLTLLLELFRRHLGYKGGAVDKVMERNYWVLNGIPYLISLFLFLMVLKQGVGTLLLPCYGRLDRKASGTRSDHELKQQDYIMRQESWSEVARLIFNIWSEYLTFVMLIYWQFRRYLYWGFP